MFILGLEEEQRSCDGRGVQLPVLCVKKPKKDGCAQPTSITVYVVAKNTKIFRISFFSCLLRLHVNPSFWWRTGTPWFPGRGKIHWCRLLLCQGIPWNCLGKESRWYNDADCCSAREFLGIVLEKSQDDIMMQITALPGNSLELSWKRIKMI